MNSKYIQKHKRILNKKNTKEFLIKKTQKNSQ